MSLQTLVVAGNKAVLKEEKYGGMPKGHSHKTVRVPGGQSWNNLKKMEL